MTFLTGMETAYPMSTQKALDDVYDLPNRDGNTEGYAMRRLANVVYDLPNRDGNILRKTRIPDGMGVYDLPNRDGN